MFAFISLLPFLPRFQLLSPISIHLYLLSPVFLVSFASTPKQSVHPFIYFSLPLSTIRLNLSPVYWRLLPISLRYQPLSIHLRLYLPIFMGIGVSNPPGPPPRASTTLLVRHLLTPNGWRDPAADMKVMIYCTCGRGEERRGGVA